MTMVILTVCHGKEKTLGNLSPLRHSLTNPIYPPDPPVGGEAIVSPVNHRLASKQTMLIWQE